MFINRTLDRLDQMLEEAQNGTFRETDYDETKLSRLESKWKQFLAVSVLSKENLEREKENVKQLVSDISHQTKTPMTNIKMYAELLMENLSAEECWYGDSKGIATAGDAGCEAAKEAEQEGIRAAGREAAREEEPEGIRDAGCESAKEAEQEAIRLADREAAIEFNRAKNRKLAAEIIRQTEKLEFLIQSLTKLSRLESNVVAVLPEKTSLQALVSGAVASIMPRAESKNIRIVNTYKETGTACFDLKWTKEALENILDNAVKYSPSGSRITISVREYQIYTAVAVKDEGIGISEEEIPRIFERFHRGGDVAQEEGVGVGLYLARQILSKENGYIKVKSVPGKGSEFSLYLMR